jgi:hypothetical protein
MWGIDSQLVDGVMTATLDETAAAVRLLAGRVRVIAEGAARLRPRPRSRGAPDQGKSCALCPAATSTRRG